MNPPNRLIHFSPIFPVQNLRRSLAHYKSLGFETKAYSDGDQYGFADRDGIGLHLAAEPDHRPEVGASETYLYVEDADALYAEWSRPGIGGITNPVGTMAYDLREGSHKDPDGNVIRFGSPISSNGPPLPRLKAHLESHYGIQVAKMFELDNGVFHVERDDGPSWVVRRFPPARPIDATMGDRDVLRFLADHDFPAERCAALEPVSVLNGQGLLVTEYVAGVERQERRAVIRDLGGLRQIGVLLGRLHTLPGGEGAPARQGGAWHHLAEGTPGHEIEAAAKMLSSAGAAIPVGQRRLFRSLSARLTALDRCEGLPQALIHPDFVLPNVVASRDSGLVIVDWTGAGRGARLWSLAFLLFVEGAKDLRRIDLLVAGYRRYANLEAEELSRLAAVALARPVIFAVWSFCMGRKDIAETVREVADASELAEAVGARANAAFAAST